MAARHGVEPEPVQFYYYNFVLKRISQNKCTVQVSNAQLGTKIYRKVPYMLGIINNVMWSRQKLFVAVTSQNWIAYNKIIIKEHSKLQPSLLVGVHY